MKLSSFADMALHRENTKESETMLHRVNEVKTVTSKTLTDYPFFTRMLNLNLLEANRKSSGRLRPV